MSLNSISNIQYDIHLKWYTCIVPHMFGEFEVSRIVSLATHSIIKIRNQCVHLAVAGFRYLRFFSVFVFFPPFFLVVALKDILMLISLASVDLSLLAL